MWHCPPAASSSRLPRCDGCETGLHYSRPCISSRVSVITGLLLTLDSFPSTNTQVLVLTPVPGMGLIPTRFRCSVAVPFISVAYTYVLGSLLAVLYLRLGSVRVDCVPSELAATFLSLRSIYLTPNPIAMKIVSLLSFVFYRVSSSLIPI